MTHLTSPRHLSKNSSPQESLPQLFSQIPTVHLRHAQKCRIIVVSFLQTFTELTQISVMSHTHACTYLCFLDIPKTSKTSNFWLLVFHLGNSTLVRCIKLALQISCQNSLCPPLVVCPLFYMESKSHLCETSHLFGSLCPFANPHSTECHTLFWT